MAYPLQPSRALLHPAWLTSLGVLALNDHLLKGADLLPAALTGKLSDVAGMLVAPLLLAALLRVRRFGSWVACHLAVGAVFAAIQISPAAADAWSVAMGALGFPWVITRDLGDLGVLPILALSLWGFVPAMRRPARANARRSAELGAATAGLLCCVATSSPDEEWDPEPLDEPQDLPSDDEGGQELPAFDADVYLSNATAQDQVLRIRALRADVAIDCETVAESPGTLLRSSLFEPAQTWTLPANTNIPVVDHLGGERPCYAAWIEADGLLPIIAMWRDGDPWMSRVEGQGQLGLPGELLLRGSAEALTLDGRDGLLHPMREVDPPVEGSCATQPDGDRVGWSTPVPWGAATVAAVESGVDGCLAIDLARGADQPDTWYLCVPARSFPFVAGDEVELRLVGSAPGQTTFVDAIEIVALDDDLPQALPSMIISAGNGLPSTSGLELGTLPLYSCEASSEPVCGTVERPVSLVLGGEGLPAAEVEAARGTVQVAGEGRLVDVTLMHAQERFVVDPECAMGPVELGLDLELVVTQRAPLGG
ncbi:MAG: hypothetical protein KC501_34765 [Myxococcales bacterium]|nr:hypothetical protein [Myxococcales bacterium]